MRLPLRSPEIATFMFLRPLFFDRSVKRSHSVCVGCSWLPSPPLITGNLRIFGGQPCGAVARMADDDDVGIVADDADGVGEALALGRGADRRIGAGDIGAAEPQHGAFERQPRARRRLVEQARQDEFGRDAGAAPDPVRDIFVLKFLQKPVRDLEDRLDLLVGQIVDRDEVARERLGFRHQSGAIGPIRAVRQARLDAGLGISAAECTGTPDRIVLTCTTPKEGQSP